MSDKTNALRLVLAGCASFQREVTWFRTAEVVDVNVEVVPAGFWTEASFSSSGEQRTYEEVAEHRPGVPVDEAVMTAIIREARMTRLDRGEVLRALKSAIAPDWQRLMDAVASQRAAKLGAAYKAKGAHAKRRVEELMLAHVDDVTRDELVAAFHVERGDLDVATTGRLPAAAIAIAKEMIRAKFSAEQAELTHDRATCRDVLES